VVILAVALGLPGTVRASLLLYEGFSVPGDYSAGATLDQKSAAGLNLVGSWDAPNNPWGRYVTEATGLADPAGHLVVSDGGLSVTRTESAPAGVPKYARATIANNSATQTGHAELWASALLSVNTAGTAFVSVQLTPDGISADPAEYVYRLTMGLDGTTAFAATDHSNFGNSSGSMSFVNRTDDTIGSYARDETHLLLARLGNKILPGDVDALQAWVNPDLSAGLAGLGSPDIQVTSGNMIFDAGSLLAGNAFQFSFRTTNVSPQTAYLDELRVGTTYGDVAPVSTASAAIPEPLSVSVLALALAAALVKRRRR
jgi:hypothetical protein